MNSDHSPVRGTNDQEHEPASVPPDEAEAREAQDPAAETVRVEAPTELEVTEVDPIVQADLQDMVSDVEALVAPTLGELATGDAAEAATLVETEPPAAPDDLAAEPEAITVAVEAELQAEALAEANEAEPALDVVTDTPITSEAELGVVAAASEPAPEAERPVEVSDPTEVEGEKSRPRGRKTRESAPAVAEAVQGLSQASQAATPSATMRPKEVLRDVQVAATADPEPLPLNGSLSLEALVESLLFVADGAVPVSRLAEALEVHPREVEAALAALAETYQHRGLSLQRHRDRVQLTTAPAAAALVERFLGLAASTPLSRAALEALAIVAYQQPVTRPQIEAVRGVNSDSVIKNLLTKGLIEESGRGEGPGRPVLYSTTTEFMQHFGLSSLNDLPPLTSPMPEPGTEARTADDLLKG